MHASVSTEIKVVTPISHAMWQALRVVKRSTSGEVYGFHMRWDLSRRTRDGSFLINLVNVGLLKVTKSHPDNPFMAKYRLTELGKVAAEYGQAELPLGSTKKLGEVGSDSAKAYADARKTLEELADKKRKVHERVQV